MQRSADLTSRRLKGDGHGDAELPCRSSHALEQVREYLSGTADEAEVVAQELQAQPDGIHSVPSVVIGKHRVSGGQPPEYFTRVLQAAAAKAGNV
ncbi:hypothetical protein CS8_025070 [Cupriavidus sp. 8B]